MQTSRNRNLSGRELFRYRAGLEKTLPEKGGAKEYMPDGSWLQAKHLEKLYEEERTILKEPRVQRGADLVQGTWNPVKRLVEIQHELGKFWMKMGFVDYNRKWLFPEEALFLMETTVLMVLWNGVPVSIQQAYSMFLDQSFTLQMYQVYAHLCRVGYVVLRHQGRLNVSQYEKEIGLDKCLSRKQRKMMKRKARGDGDSRKGGKQDDGQPAEVKMKVSSDHDNNSYQKLANTADERPVKKPKLGDPLSSDEPIKVEILKGREEVASEGQDPTPSRNKSHVQGSGSSREPSILWHGGKGHVADGETKVGKYKATVWNFSEIGLPDLSVSETIVTRRPSSHLLPDNLCLKDDVYTYRKSEETAVKWKCHGDVRNHDDIGNHGDTGSDRGEESDDEVVITRSSRSVGSLQFSFVEGHGKPKTWSEYKQKVDRLAMLPHLYGGSVTPLVDQGHTNTTGCVLDRLALVQEDQPGVRSTEPAVMPDFDVYVPDTKFRKSSPGLPDHRVCVVSSSSPLPDLMTVSAMREFLGDSVSTLWAVVDSGEISFYDIADLSLPVDISMG